MRGLRAKSGNRNQQQSTHPSNIPIFHKYAQTHTQSSVRISCEPSIIPSHNKVAAYKYPDKNKKKEDTNGNGNLSVKRTNTAPSTCTHPPQTIREVARRCDRHAASCEPGSSPISPRLATCALHAVLKTPLFFLITGLQAVGPGKTTRSVRLSLRDKKSQGHGTGKVVYMMYTGVCPKLPAPPQHRARCPPSLTQQRGRRRRCPHQQHQPPQQRSSRSRPECTRGPHPCRTGTRACSHLAPPWRRTRAVPRT